MMKSNTKAYTIAEMTFVIAIASILLVGTLGAMNIAKVMKINAVIKDMEKYETAINLFKNTYKLFPGDYNKSYITFNCGADTEDICSSYTSLTNSICNGKGLKYYDTLSNSNDAYCFMALGAKQLAAAGFLNNIFTQDYSIFTLDYSRLLYSTLNGEGKFLIIPANYNERFLYRISKITSDTDFESYGTINILTPDEILILDMKIDDGKPGSGRLTTSDTYGLTNCATSSEKYNDDSAYKNQQLCYLNVYLN